MRERLTNTIGFWPSKGRVSHFRKSCQMIMHILDIVMHAILRSCANFHFFSQSFWSPAKHFNFTRRNAQKYKGKWHTEIFWTFWYKINIKKRVDFKNPFCWLRRIFWYPYCHILCHLCHVTCVIKCQKMSFYDTCHVT